MNTAGAMTIDPLFLRHDLMLELGYLELTIADARAQPAADAASDEAVHQLESRCARINEALCKLPA